MRLRGDSAASAKGSIRAGAVRRPLATLALALLVCLTAVGVGAAADPPVPSLPDGISPADVPGAEANRLAGEAWQVQQREERQREEYLASPEAEAARERSRDAYAGPYSVSEVADLLRLKFGDQLSELNRDPARALGRVSVKKVITATSALVSDGGEPGLIDSIVPLRAEDDTGRMAPVDLTLRSDGDRLETDNGLVDVSLPTQSGDPIHLGSDLSFSVASAGAEMSTNGRLFGDQAEVLPQGAGTDQDLILSPVSVGVDVATLIRSRDAAESYGLDFDLAPGATLTRQDDGSVEVRDGEDVIARVHAPSATDAQGQVVPSHLAVSGSTVMVVTEFKDGDYAMPIYSDPVVDTYNWTSGSSITGWGFAADNTGNSTSCQFSSLWFYAMVVDAPGACAYKNSTWGQWLYYPPGLSTFVRTATFGRLSYSDACSHTYTEPHAYVGVYRRTAPAKWRSLSMFGPPVSSVSKTTTPDEPDFGSPHDVVVAGVGTPQIDESHDYYNLCERTFAFQDASITLSDPEPPSVGSLAHGSPAGDGSFAWVDSTGDATVAMHAVDPGLGVAGTAVYYPKAGGGWDGSHAVVTGSAPSCDATAASPCPSSYTSSPIAYPLADFGEGATTAQAWAWDPLWWAHQDDWNGVIHQKAKSFDVRIDRSPPQVAISGSAIGGAGDSLNVTATDGSPSPESARRSGVKSLVVLVAGTQVFNQSQGCTPIAIGSCSLATPASFELSTDDFDEGPLTVTATAKDQLGDQTGLQHSHQQSSTAIVYLGGPEGTASVTGGPDGYTADTTPTFTYTSTTSGSAFKCKVDSGPWVKCDPSGFTTGTLTDGPHTFYVRNWHGPGANHPNPASRSFTVDTQGPSITATAPLDQISPTVAGRSVTSEVTATDSGSGAVRIVFALDDDGQDAVMEDCPNGGCTLTETLAANFTDEDLDGAHTYKLIAADAVGNVSTKTGTLMLDAEDPVLTVTGDLPDSADDLMPGDTVSATIDVEDSRQEDTGVAEVQVLVDGELDHAQSPSCAAGCPSTFQAGYTYDKTAWSEGAHEVTITAADAAGNTARVTYELNVTPDPPDEICPVVLPTQQTSHDVLDEIQAADGFPLSVTEPSTPTIDPDSGQELAPRWDVLPDPGDPFVSEGSLAFSTMGSEPAGGFEIDNEFCLMPLQTTADETQAATVSHQQPDPEDPNNTETIVDAAMFANVATDTDLAIRPTATGVTTVVNLRGDQAPTELSWKIGLEDSLELRQLSNGALAVVDPAEPPQGLTVPQRNNDAENIDHIADITVQLDESAYQIAAAEEELDEYVYSVLANPYGATDSGALAHATWTVTNSDTITVDIPADTIQLVIPTFDGPNAKAPKHVDAHYPSWYPAANQPAEMYDWGCEFSQSLDSSKNLNGRRIRNMIVDFGGARRDYRTGVGLFGGSDWTQPPDWTDPPEGDRFVPERRIVRLLKKAVEGYNSCPHQGDQKMRLVLGMSNDQAHVLLDKFDSNHPQGQAPDSLLLRNAWLAGKRMNTMVWKVKKKKENMRFGVGTDTEAHFDLDRPDLAVKLAHGMASGNFMAFNYGTAENCRTDQGCTGAWTKEHIARISQGWRGVNKAINVLPQIYQGYHRKDWRKVAKYWRDQGHKFSFYGVTAQPDIPGSGCRLLAGPKKFLYKSAEAAWSSFHRKEFAPNVGRELVRFDCPQVAFPGP